MEDPDNPEKVVKPGNAAIKLRNIVIKNSIEKERDSAYNEWFLSESFSCSDLGGQVRCICDTMNGIYVHELINKFTGKKLYPIGNTCIKHFTNKNDKLKASMILFNHRIIFDNKVKNNVLRKDKYGDFIIQQEFKNKEDKLIIKPQIRIGDYCINCLNFKQTGINGIVNRKRLFCNKCNRSNIWRFNDTKELIKFFNCDPEYTQIDYINKPEKYHKYIKKYFINKLEYIKKCKVTLGSNNKIIEKLYCTTFRNNSFIDKKFYEILENPNYYCSGDIKNLPKECYKLYIKYYKEIIKEYEKININTNLSCIKLYISFNPFIKDFKEEYKRQKEEKV